MSVTNLATLPNSTCNIALSAFSGSLLVSYSSERYLGLFVKSRNGRTHMGIFPLLTASDYVD
jgi:hypothetical protein